MRFIKRTVKFSYSEFRRIQNVRPTPVPDDWLTELVMEGVAQRESRGRGQDG
jgi:hypothetical protein